MTIGSTHIAVALAAALTISGPGLAAPGADVYGALPGITAPVISPDGKHVVALIPRGNDTAVRIGELGGKVCDYLPPGVKVRRAFWASPSRVAVAVSFYYAPENTSEGRRYASEVYRFLTLDTNCGAGVELLRDHPDYARLAGFDYIGRSGDSLLFEALTDSARGAGQGNSQPTRFDDKRRETFRLDVYKVDPATGKSEKFETGKVGTYFWFVDASGTLRLRGDINPVDRSRTVLAKLDGANDWVEVYREAASTPEERQFYFLGIGPRPDAAYVMTRNGGDKDAIYEFDLRTKSLGKQVFSHPRVDADGVARDPYTRRPVGFSYTLDVPKTEFIDRAYAQHQADVEATFPGEFVQIMSQSVDGNRYLAYVEGKENPGGWYHVVDTAASDISLVGKRFEALTAADLAPVRSFAYKARDGLDIPAYVTLPPGAAGKNLPLVVLPHGGPGARDDMTFDAWSQFLATRGYAVLRPNFRGSTGYGAGFYAAGRFQWGLKMQDDLTDGVKALIADGTVNKDRVCIFGWSYGGYAAMAGLAFSPELYKCAAAGAGISDLMVLSGQIRRSSDASYLSGDSWRNYIGDPATDADRLRATSPVNAAARIVAPLLLFHGRKDTTVLPAQSEKMVDALDKQGKWVKLIMFEDEDHWIARNATGKRVLSELETFLAENLKK